MFEICRLAKLKGVCKILFWNHFANIALMTKCMSRSTVNGRATILFFMKKVESM